MNKLEIIMNFVFFLRFHRKISIGKSTKKKIRKFSNFKKVTGATRNFSWRPPDFSHEIPEIIRKFNEFIFEKFIFENIDGTS